MQKIKFPICTSLVGALIFSACTFAPLQAGDEPIALTRAELEKLEGVWVLKAEPKEGWKGTVRATITLYPVDGKAADFGRIYYDCDLADGSNKLKIANAPSGGISFAGVKRGKTMALVTSKTFARAAPFKVESADSLSAPFEIKDDKLTLDLSKSLKAFVPGTASEMKIDWSKATWEKIKK
jgi:hypothetical protein